jgi:hypothetical protein
VTTKSLAEVDEQVVRRPLKAVARVQIPSGLHCLTSPFPEGSGLVVWCGMNSWHDRLDCGFAWYSLLLGRVIWWFERFACSAVVCRVGSPLSRFAG